MNKRSYKSTPPQTDTSTPLKSLKLLASDTRFDILCLLHGSETHMCVTDIADSVDLTHSAASHQLRKLENAGVLSVAREGQTRCYEFAHTPVAEQTIAFIKECA